MSGQGRQDADANPLARERGDKAATTRMASRSVHPYVLVEPIQRLAEHVGGRRTSLIGSQRARPCSGGVNRPASSSPQVVASVLVC